MFCLIREIELKEEDLKKRKYKIKEKGGEKQKRGQRKATFVNL